jgi:hypothetical protein
VSTSTLCYRGVAYDPAQRQRRPLESATPLEHVYRGVLYSAPLRHAAAPVNPAVELHYRGSVYHHRQAEAAAELWRTAKDPAAV